MGPEDERKPTHASATIAARGVAFGRGTASATAKALRKIYVFRCSAKAGLFAVSLNPAGDNLPANVCTGGEWVRHSEVTVDPGVSHLVGFVATDLYRDLERQGYHLASGVRVATLKVTQQDQTVQAVGDALAAADRRTGFFTTDPDA